MRVTLFLNRSLGGRFSSMLDMGGVATVDANTKIDTGKNNKIRTIALDFDLITRSIEQSTANINSKSNLNKSSNINKSDDVKDKLIPDVSKIQNLASLLGVNLGDSQHNLKRSSEKDEDLSLLIGSKHKNKQIENNKTENITVIQKMENENVNTQNIPSLDVRAKYANKLRSKVDGGLAGVELAKQRREDMMKNGDASGHFAARSIAASQTVATSGSKWLVNTGTGTLLTYLNNRSMQVALLPTPTILTSLNNDIDAQMDTFVKQLPQIKIHHLVKNIDIQHKDNNQIAHDIISNVEKNLNVTPSSTILVSDRDDLLRAAKEKGMFTCRVRRPNAPRGNVTTNYNVEEVQGVEEIVNELNGISFNAVFSK